MRRVLKDTGSIYLHCDPTAGHYLKLLTDTVFGSGQIQVTKSSGSGLQLITVGQSAGVRSHEHGSLFYSAFRRLLHYGIGCTMDIRGTTIYERHYRTRG